MHIALLGPMHTADLQPLLAGAADPAPALGYAGAPFLATFAAALRARGHRLTLVTTDKDARLERPRRLHGEEVELVVCPARRYGTLPNGLRPGKAMDFFAAERRHLRAVLEEAAPDVVHAHWAYEFGLAAVDTKLPAVISVHDSPADVLRSDKTPYNALRYLMARRCLRAGRRLAAVSPFIRDRVQASFGADPACVLPNPLPLETIADIRAACGRFEAPTVVFVSNYWGRLKNPDIALGAFAQARQRMPDLRLLCVGRDFGPDGPAARWAAGRGRDAGVSFLGARSHRQTLELIAQASVLLHTSRVESFGMAVAEAMALGTPVIVDARAGALPWLVEQGAAGVMTDTTDIDGLAQSLLDLLSDADTWRGVAARGVARARALCAPAAIAAQADILYRTLGAS
jgi:glycosyltransferase involved in cell wall biosynthesis